MAEHENVEHDAETDEVEGHLAKKTQDPRVRSQPGDKDTDDLKKW